MSWAVEADEDVEPLPAAVEVAAYRIVMEAVTNALRHSGAERCTVSLQREDGDAAAPGPRHRARSGGRPRRWCRPDLHEGARRGARWHLHRDLDATAAPWSRSGLPISGRRRRRELRGCPHPRRRRPRGVPARDSRPCSALPTASRWSAAPPTVPVPSTSPWGCSPTSCSWTCRCRASTASRPPAGSSRSSPHISVLVLTMMEDEDSVFAAVRAGARGYLLKGARRQEIVRAIEAVGAGEVIFGPGIADRMMTYFGACGRARRPRSSPSSPSASGWSSGGSRTASRTARSRASSGCRSRPCATTRATSSPSCRWRTARRRSCGPARRVWA